MAGVLIALHAEAAVIWVGGMFFAYTILRPATGPMAGPDRLNLWRRNFKAFFAVVWAAIVVLLATGYGMIFGIMGGFAGAGLHIHLMQALGIAMMLLFFHLYFAPWKRLKRKLDAEDYQGAAADLGQIRRIVGTNLILGLITVSIGASGRYWG
ncbi:MAG: hypothetical protein CMM50_04065 [Rhodospirillaceae bacterium]|nr:hypothetical protein [Rhodospirillaceae bacterium]|tara:strand:+ start:82 stop:540 length:459 start_codon:yes stop_codon:yes gene_type:complete